MKRARRQKGFLVIAAVFLLVVLAALVAYLMTVSTTSQASSAADYDASRAYQAARAGAEWAAYEILRSDADPTFRNACGSGAATRNLAFGASTLASYAATVTCTSATTSEGASPTVVAYKIVSNACNQPNSGACPNASALSATYVEREVVLTLTR
jgi:MSHA biogenesis protein MshP